MQKDRRRKRFAGYVLLAWLVPLLSIAGGRDAEPRYDFNIPALKAGAALDMLAKQTNAQLLFPYDVVESINANRVSGRYTLSEALSKLLQGTGLSSSLTTAHVITITASKLNAEQKGEQSVPKSKNWSFLAAIATFFAGGAHTATADEQPGTQPSATLEEVVVTAQKREERLIDVPQSVSVLSSADLASLGATQFRDFANSVPGLNFATEGAGATQITLRGITVGGDVSSAVGIYLDDVPYGSSTVFSQAAQFAFDAAPFDLDRIEVLRGPQGTLYGASAMGGLIKYVSRRPDTQSFGGSAQAGVATTEDGGPSYNVAATANVPILSDRAALRASAFESHDGGYIDNVALGRKDVNRSDVYGGRLDLLLTPTEQLSIRLDGFLQDISRDGEGTADYTFAGGKPYGDLGQFRRFAEPFNQQFRLGSATITYDLNWASLISISSYQTVRSHYLFDLSAGFAPLFGVLAVGLPADSGTDKFTQEIRLTSRPGGRPLEWAVGGFYTHETSSLSEQFLLRDLGGTLLPSAGIAYLAPSLYDEYAVFGDVTWHFTEAFDVTGGVRYAHNKQNESQSGAFGSHPQIDSEDHVVTYLANARYHFSDRAMAYLRFATGYRPGGPNVVTSAGGSPTFEADTLKSYEAGFKTGTADDRLGAEIAAYNVNWSNIQISVNRGGFQAITNAPGGARVRGAELTLSARPVHELKLSAALTYTDAELAHDDAALGGAGGERLPITPRFSGSLNGDYELPLGTLRPTLGASVRRLSDRTISFNHSPSYPQYTLPAYTTVDLRGGLSFHTVDIQLYVHNLADERGQLSVLYPQFGDRVAIMQPRTVGINLSTAF